MRLRILLLAAVLALTAIHVAPTAGAPVTSRVPGTIRIRGNPDGLGRYALVEAFPNLRFRKPLYIGYPPDGSNRLFVLEQDGVVRWFENRRDARESYVALDIRAKVYTRHSEEGLLGMAFHPAFRENGHVYLHYSANGPRRGVIARYTFDRSRRRIRPRSEKVILQQPQPYGNHNGGGIEFGPDGFLYIAFGDGGAANDPHGHGQNLGTWLATLLRIDVDRGAPYAVPKDNPFLGVRGARPEIWAYGLRNLWRFSFDRVTGDLWGGDVGQVAWEEVDIVVRGGNYGWNVREGHSPFRPRPTAAPLLDPVISLDRREARSVTGGYVYRGSRIPSLIGAYLYADYETGNVWALRWDGKQVTQNLLIGRGRHVASFGEDAAGEVYFTSLDGRIYTFAEAQQPTSQHEFPRRLSDTGLFTDTARMAPHPALVPYSVNVELWSDGAAKQRYIMLPDRDAIRVGTDGSYGFPRGTIFVKTFLAGTHRLETRLLLHRDSGWQGFTYVWNEAQTDALLIDGRVDQVQPPHVARHLAAPTWTFPGRSDCMSCHTAAAGYVLGFRREQLDRMHDQGGTRENQLAGLDRLGYFAGTATAPRPAWPDWNDPKAEPTAQIRAYLDANCAFCHRPGGTGNARIDLRFEVPLEKTHLVGEPPGQGDLGVRGARMVVPGDPRRSLLYLRMLRTDSKGMPNLAHNAVDSRATDRLARWVRSLR